MLDLPAIKKLCEADPTVVFIGDEVLLLVEALEEAQARLKALTGLYIKHNAGGHYKDDRSCAACQRDRILKGE